jgi:hypothetical protein
MQIRREHFLVPVLAIAVGGALLYVGLWASWGIVWAAAGGFFLVLGLAAELLALTWRLPGPLGRLLRQPLVGILIVGAVVVALATVTALAILSRFS